MKFYDIKAAFTSLNLAYKRLINFQQFSELSLCYPPISRLLRKRPMTWWYKCECMLLSIISLILGANIYSFIGYTKIEYYVVSNL